MWVHVCLCPRMFSCASVLVCLPSVVSVQCMCTLQTCLFLLPFSEVMGLKIYHQRQNSVGKILHSLAKMGAQTIYLLFLYAAS